MQQLRDTTQRMPQGKMQIAPEQGQFIALLIKLLNAKRTLEIGVFTGYSSLAVALALPDTGKIIACDTSREWTDIAKRHWLAAGVAHKIDLRLGQALQTLNELLSDNQQNSFDFAFIDADKGNYDNYYECCLKLVRPGGLIAIDNVLWSGSVIDASINDKDTVAIRRLNEKLAIDERIDISLIPIADGLTLARKRA